MVSMKPMLAASADVTKITYPIWAQPKLDGIRCVIVDGKPLTRTLKEVPNKEIFAALSRPEYEGLDGELVVGPPTAADAYRATTSYVMAHDKVGVRWRYFVFDKHDHGGTYSERREWLNSNPSGVFGPAPSPLVRLSSKLCETAEALEEFEAWCLSDGYEGAILRHPDALYKHGRGTTTKGDLLKLKRFIDFEAEIVDVYEEMHNGNEPTRNALGRTERSSVQANKTGKGTLGGFFCVALNGPAEGTEFKVGTGFTADNRAAFWVQQDEIIGHVAKVKSFPIGAKEKPRHPVFLGFRDLSYDG